MTFGLIPASQTNLQTYNLVIGATTTAPTLGTTTFNQAYYAQASDRCLIKFYLQQTAIGTSGSGTYLFPIPPNLTIDSNKAPVGFAPTSSIVGKGAMTASTSGNTETDIYIYDSTHLAVLGGNAGVIMGSSYYYLGQTVLQFSFYAEVPIVGWSA